VPPIIVVSPWCGGRSVREGEEATREPKARPNRDGCFFCLFIGLMLYLLFSGSFFFFLFNFAGEFDNAGAMMSIDETLMCSFQILKPADKKARYAYGGQGNQRPATPPRGQGN
jgi:hypothetical protein